MSTENLDSLIEQLQSIKEKIDGEAVVDSAGSVSNSVRSVRGDESAGSVG